MRRGFDSIVVLGCRVLPSGEPSPTLARRARAAAKAYREGVAPLVVASGGRRWEGWCEATVIAEVLAGEGVPDEAVILELASLSTTENAIFTARVLHTLGAKRAVLATSAWHMARALTNFRAAGVDVEGLAEAPGEPKHASLGRSAMTVAWRRAYEFFSMLRDERAMRHATTLRAGAEWLGGERRPHVRRGEDFAS